MPNITNREFLVCVQRVDQSIVPKALVDVLRGRLNLRTLSGAKLLKSILDEPVDFSAVNFRIAAHTDKGIQHIRRIEVAVTRSGVGFNFNTSASVKFTSFNNERVCGLFVLCDLPFLGERILSVPTLNNAQIIRRFVVGETLTILFGDVPVLRLH